MICGEVCNSSRYGLHAGVTDQATDSKQVLDKMHAIIMQRQRSCSLQTYVAI